MLSMDGFALWRGDAVEAGYVGCTGISKYFWAEAKGAIGDDVPHCQGQRYVYRFTDFIGLPYQPYKSDLD